MLLVLVLARIAWRLTHRPPPFEEWMHPGEKRTAAAAHAAIYALLLVMTVSGYVRTVGDGFPDRVPGRARHPAAHPVHAPGGRA